MLSEHRKAYMKEYKKKWHKEHPGAAVRHSKTWRDKNIEKDRENTSIYRKRSNYWAKRTQTIKANPVMYSKFLARQAVHQAVKSGKIQRLSCTVCSEVKTQGHHPDYSQPLNVVWLCHQHHVEIHNKVSHL